MESGAEKRATLGPSEGNGSIESHDGCVNEVRVVENQVPLPRSNRHAQVVDCQVSDSPRTPSDPTYGAVVIKIYHLVRVEDVDDDSDGVRKGPVNHRTAADDECDGVVLLAG